MTKLYNGIYFNDYEGCTSFDVFGNSLIILFEICTIEQAKLIWDYTHRIIY